jgi:arginyl-tRNA synthetase
VIPADLSNALVNAARAAVADGELVGAVPEEALLTWKNGGYITPMPMRLTAPDHRPRQVAELLARRLTNVGTVTVTNPGFLTITPDQPGDLASHIVETGHYGRASLPRPATVWPDRPRTFGNPGFVVRFAYARAASVRRHARDLGLARGTPKGLDDPYELTLLGRLAELPGRAAQAVREDDAAPYQRHILCLADAYHDVHEHCPALPRGDEPTMQRHGARLTLAEAVRIALNNGLRTLGENPEEHI